MASWILPEKEKPPSLDSSLFGKLLYQPREQFLCLLVYVGKVIVQLAAYQQIAVAHFVILL